MKIRDDSAQRRVLSNTVYWITLLLMGVYFALYFALSPNHVINLFRFDSLVPVLLTGISILCIALNKFKYWGFSRGTFLFTWMMLVNILPPILIGVNSSSYVVHPVLCIISSLMVHLFFSFYSSRWAYVSFLIASFVLTLFSFDFLKLFDDEADYRGLPLNHAQVTTIYVMCWIFINLTLVYIYRINWKAHNELRVKNEVIEKMNAELETRVETRTKQLKERNDRLQNYAFMNAHIVRAPLSRILGLINLLKNSGHDPQEEPLIQKYLSESADELDEIIRNNTAALEKNIDDEGVV
jgi:signal transduction histidine kinase